MMDVLLWFFAGIGVLATLACIVSWWVWSRLSRK